MTANQKIKLPFAELVGIVAAAMALNALAVDMMLPALGIIGEELGAAHDNDRQLIIIIYVLANGVAQLFFGPIVDRFGRKRVMLWSLAAYIVGSLLSVFASSFTLLLAARAFQGAATAATRVSAIAVVRDQCSGRRMAEVMSLAVTIFMAAPILAPGIGQLILMIAPWRWIFIALLGFGAVYAVWAAFRLPETMAPEDRKPLRSGPIAASYLAFLSNRTSMGYTLGAAFCFGVVFSYISASEQIFLETFKVGDAFALVFACVAGSLAVATLLNSRMVSRFGMRRLSPVSLRRGDRPMYPAEEKAARRGASMVSGPPFGNAYNPGVPGFVSASSIPRCPGKCGMSPFSAYRRQRPVMAGTRWRIPAMPGQARGPG